MSRNGHRGYTSLGSVVHIVVGVALTAIGFAQIYLGFNLYERRSRRKVPVAVKVIWAVIVGLFSLYLIILALRSQLKSRKERSSPKFSRNKKRKAALYGNAQSPLVSPALDRTMSWEFITGGPSSPVMSGSRSPEMQQVRMYPKPETYAQRQAREEQERQQAAEEAARKSPLFSAVPMRGGTAGVGSTSDTTLQNQQNTEAVQPFSSLSTLSPFSDAHAVTQPEQAHFSSRPPLSQRSSSPTARLLPLPVVHQAPVIAGPGPGTSTVSLQAIDEEAAVETGASVSGFTASTGESSFRPMLQARARASTGMLPETGGGAAARSSGEERTSGEADLSGSSREDLLQVVTRRESAPSPSTGGSTDGRRSVASIRRKAVPPLLP